MAGMSLGVGMGTSGGWPQPGGGGGGEEAPAWVRSGAIADIDFVNNPPRAWTATGGEVAFANFDTILGSSELIADRAYNSAKMELGVGYGLHTGDLADEGAGTFLGDLVDAWNFDFTAVIECTGNFQLEYTEETFGTDLTINLGIAGNGNLVRFADANGDSLKPDGSPPADAVSAIAISVSAASAYGSYNGEPLYLFGDSGEATTMDPATPNQPTDIVFIGDSIQRITAYQIKNEADTLALTA